MLLFPRMKFLFRLTSMFSFFYVARLRISHHLGLIVCKHVSNCHPFSFLPRVFHLRYNINGLARCRFYFRTHIIFIRISFRAVTSPSYHTGFFHVSLEKSQEKLTMLRNRIFVLESLHIVEWGERKQSRM